ncbi:sigma-70 family RNA polymerase sigma factor [Patescibacteria group bacterium]|nr:sigma-70 family RNA polymerase sigma factor [Patescibacteria group bacterium]
MPNQNNRADALVADELLFTKLKQDPSAVGEVYDRYADRLYAFLLKRCGHAETAEDLVSHTFVKFLETLPRLTWQGVPFSALLFRIGSNALTDHWRKSSTQKDVALDLDEWEPPSEDSPAWTTEIVMEGERIRDAMKLLSSRDQEVLDLRFYAGLEAREIATMLETTPNHAAVLVYRAVGRLREKLTTVSAEKSL